MLGWDCGVDGCVGLVCFPFGEDALDAVFRIRSQRFDHCKSLGVIWVGMVAENLERVLPILVVSYEEEFIYLQVL